MVSPRPITMWSSWPLRNTSYLIWDCGSTLSVDCVQSSQISGTALSDDSARFDGAVGGVVSVTAGVVTGAGVLCAALPGASPATALNAEVGPGERSGPATPFPVP